MASPLASKDIATTSGPVTVTTSSTPIVDADTGRSRLVIQNLGPTNYVCLTLQTAVGTDPTAVLDQGVKLVADGDPLILEGFTGAVAGIAKTASCTVVVMEY